MKRCSMCGKRKKESCFYRKGKWWQSRCKECKKEANHQHYLDNKGRYLECNAAFKAKRLAALAALKEDQGCYVCDEATACALDFHHVESEAKEFDIACGYTLSWERLLEEINKCVVLCKNCHAKLHNGLFCLLLRGWPRSKAPASQAGYTGASPVLRSS